MLLPEFARRGGKKPLLPALPSCPLPVFPALPPMPDPPDGCLAGPDGPFMEAEGAELAAGPVAVNSHEHDQSKCRYATHKQHHAPRLCMLE